MPPRPSPTHFLCIPLVTSLSRPQLGLSLSAFAADVTSPDSFGIPADAVRPLGTLHLTLGVMSFPKGVGIDKAVDLLKTRVPDIVRDYRASVLLGTNRPSAPNNASEGKQQQQQPPRASAETTTASPEPQKPLLLITLKGLHSMQQASKATVLYAAPVDEQGALQKFCETLKKAFQDEGLMMDESRPLLLHATIINTIYVKGGGHQGRKKERLTLDARGILDRYDDLVWMDSVPVEKIAICRMGAKKLEDGDEAYEVEAEIDITNLD